MKQKNQFGVFMSVVFFLCSYLAFLGGSALTLILALILFGGLFAILVVTDSTLLLPLKRVWLNIGRLMGLIVNPMVIGVLFLCIITPYAFLGRCLKRDVLRLKRRPVKTYWVQRKEQQISAQSFRNQF